MHDLQSTGYTCNTYSPHTCSPCWSSPHTCSPYWSSPHTCSPCWSGCVLRTAFKDAVLDACIHQASELHIAACLYGHIAACLYGYIAACLYGHIVACLYGHIAACTLLRAHCCVHIAACTLLHAHCCMHTAVCSRTAFRVWVWVKLRNHPIKFIPKINTLSNSS